MVSKKLKKLGSHLRDSIGHCLGFFKKQGVSGNDYGVKDTFKAPEHDILISVCRFDLAGVQFYRPSLENITSPGTKFPVVLTST